MDKGTAWKEPVARREQNASETEYGLERHKIGREKSREEQKEEQRREEREKHYED